MTREDLQEWHKDWEDKKVSGDAYALFLNTYINILESRVCDTCTHCDKSTLTQLKQAYCNKLQTGIKDYDKFYCAYWKE